MHTPPPQQFGLLEFLADDELEEALKEREIHLVPSPEAFNNSIRE